MVIQQSRAAVRTWYDSIFQHDYILETIFSVNVIYIQEPGDQEEERKHPVLVSNLGFLCLVLFHMIFRGIAINFSLVPGVGQIY